MKLEVKNLRKTFGENEVLHGISFSVESGKALGLLGRNGAGKTTTIRILMDVFHANSGEILLDGKPFIRKEHSIGYLPEERGLYPKKKVLEQMIYLAQLRGISKNQAKENSLKWLGRLEVEQYANNKLETLSKGNQQKVQFISAIINEPELLILDEPFSGLDPLNIELFKNVILELKDKGTSIIFSSHRMDHVELFCEKLLILVKGKTVLEGYLKNIKKDYKIKKVIIEGDVKKSELEKIDGVLSVSKISSLFKVNIKDEKYFKNIFNYIKTKDNITKFALEDSSLEEIFIAKVGEVYGK